MKALLPLFLLLFGLLASACQEEMSHSTSEPASVQLETVEDTPPILGTYTVDAPSGLNFRDAPKGNVLGKFMHGAPLDIIERSGVMDEVMDDGRALWGEWVGLAHEGKRVYVFEPFLRPVLSEEDLAISEEGYPSLYTMDSYYKKDGPTFSTIPLTGAHRWIDHPDSLSIDPAYLGKNVDPDDAYHYLDAKYRARFLKAQRISENDKVFIYNYVRDELFTYLVKDLPLIAHITVYGSYSPVPQTDYVIAFSLEKKWQKERKGDYRCLVVIGKEFPFLRGQFQPMFWTQTEDKVFPPVEVDSADLEKYARYTIKPYETYHFSHDGLNYYCRANHFKVFDAKGAVVLDQEFRSSEGTSMAGITLKGENSDLDFPGQWTGRLFKNRAPVMLGLMYVSFGCNAMEILDGSGRRHYYLCDNRH